MSTKISITGDLGSGKSTVCSILSEQKGIRKFSTGEIQRNLAQAYGMSTKDFNLYMETHPEADAEIDSELVKLSKDASDFIIDSRMAWHFIPNSFKVFMTVNLDMAATRIMKDAGRSSEKYSSPEDAVDQMISRKQSENIRYFQLYGVHSQDLNNFDLILDTSASSPEKTAELLWSSYQKWLKGDKYHKCRLSPIRLLPTKSLQNTSDKVVEKYRRLIENADGFSPIQVIYFANDFFIFDGHHKVIAAIRSGLDLLPSVVTAMEGDELSKGLSVQDYIRNEFKLSRLHDWETYLNITKGSAPRIFDRVQKYLFPL